VVPSGRCRKRAALYVSRVTTSDELAAAPAEAAIPRLMDDYAELVYRLGLRMCGDPDKAQDLVQETFIRALEGWKGFDGRAKPSTWLYTIASRACQRLERRRAGEPKKMQSLEQLLPRGEKTVVDVPADGVTPLEWVERKDVVQAVRRAIESLPMDFRLPVVLKEIEGLSVDEVAKVLGVKPATVKTRLHRGRLLMRKELSQALPHKPAERHPHDAPDPSCLDLLWAKQEAMDRGVDFPIPATHLCERCRTVFATLDLAADVCHTMQGAELPQQVREALEARVLGGHG
jgi:RNA polymerase sigma-70 factor (ECF subfamily)